MITHGIVGAASAGCVAHPALATRQYYPRRSSGLLGRPKIRLITPRRDRPRPLSSPRILDLSSAHGALVPLQAPVPLSSRFGSGHAGASPEINCQKGFARDRSYVGDDDQLYTIWRGVSKLQPPRIRLPKIAIRSSILRTTLCPVKTPTSKQRYLYYTIISANIFTSNHILSHIAPVARKSLLAVDPGACPRMTAAESRR